ncbi:MAG: class I SAM-dependent methyltransferase [Vicinamibacterales bacterium]|nr:class I SAM-dependent methyltransferase [Vicinamibacterales bacterium]
MSAPPDDSSIPKTLDGIRDLYTGNLAEHGVNSKSVGWRDEATHLLRFDRLARLVNPTVPFTVNDWGCGYGAMCVDFEQRFGAAMTGFTGYDISREMLDAARAAVRTPGARFVHGSDVTEEADYTFVSGTFNVKLESTDAEWAAYVTSRLEALWAVSRRGLAFNLLTSYVDWKEPHLFYGDPRDFFDVCKRRLSKYVTLLHDTPLYEWTILVHREPGA